jgi:Ca-activated chloride channel family protein
MHAPVRFAVALIAALTIPLVPAAQACIPPERAALLILDASYSMLRTVPRSGQTRFTIAREAIISLVELFPDDGRLALRFYGSDTFATRNNCHDTHLAVPFGASKVNRDAIKLALSAAHARGVTPIEYALQQAAGDFTADPGIERLIVVVTDGIESCGGNPCAAATALAVQGFVINTIGFLVDRSARQQLQCMAKVTGGSYFEAPVAAQLKDRLKDALYDCPVAALPPALEPWMIELGLVG